jgi:hypothetical protein
MSYIVEHKRETFHFDSNRYQMMDYLHDHQRLDKDEHFEARLNVRRSGLAPRARRGDLELQVLPREEAVASCHFGYIPDIQEIDAEQIVRGLDEMSARFQYLGCIARHLDHIYPHDHELLRNLLFIEDITVDGTIEEECAGERLAYRAAAELIRLHRGSDRLIVMSPRLSMLAEGATLKPTATLDFEATRTKMVQDHWANFGFRPADPGGCLDDPVVGNDQPVWYIHNSRQPWPGDSWINQHRPEYGIMNR